MSNLSSPTRFNPENHYNDYNDLEDRMRSPLTVKMSDYDNVPSSRRDEKLDMFVPDRILVVGQDQYYGTKAPPRELRLENSVRPPDPGMIRVKTPPRVISLSEHRFPTVGEDDDDDMPDFDNIADIPAPRILSTPKKSQALVSANEWTPLNALNGSDLSIRGLPATDEVVHLRRQMAKMNRRLMTIELETVQRQQREKYLLALGLGYYLIKFMIWLNK